MFYEYPKALYRGDEMQIAGDSAEEAELRGAGFRLYEGQAGEAVENPAIDQDADSLGRGDGEAVKRGRGRPRKAA